MNRYPYPVLTPNESSYVEGLAFVLSYLRSNFINNAIFFEFSISLNSSTLRQLIDDGYAEMVMKVQTGIYSKTFVVDTYDGVFKLSLETENIESSDTIKFTAYVLARESFEYVSSAEIIPIYGEDYKIRLKKNDLLAISNTESLSYNSGNNDFIKFSVSKQQSGKSFSIRYDTNYISVIIGPEFNMAYGKVKNSKRDACSIFDSHLVFEVFVYALIDLIQQYESYCETEWYKLFEQLFMQTGKYDSFEDFIREAKDEDQIDISLVYYMAHNMINNQIENSLIVFSNSDGD